MIGRPAKRSFPGSGTCLLMRPTSRREKGWRTSQLFLAEMRRVTSWFMKGSRTDEKGSRMNAKGLGAMRVAWRGQNSTESVLEGL